MASKVYTSGRWVVTPGQEEAFLRAWQEFADWSKTNAPGAEWALLLRDRQEPNVFVSIGPWSDVDAIAAWRESEGFKTRIAALRSLLDGLTVETLDGVLEIR